MLHLMILDLSIKYLSKNTFGTILAFPMSVLEKLDNCFFLCCCSYKIQALGPTLKEEEKPVEICSGLFDKSGP